MAVSKGMNKAANREVSRGNTVKYTPSGKMRVEGSLGASTYSSTGGKNSRQSSKSVKKQQVAFQKITGNKLEIGRPRASKITKPQGTLILPTNTPKVPTKGKK